MKRFLKITLGLLLASWLGLRLAALPRVMTHVDDIGPVAALLQAKDLSWFERMRVLQAYTYAPAQFVLTDQLLGLARTPAWALFLGRLPSFLFWLAGLALFISLLTKLDEEEPGDWPIELRLLLGAWAFLSWRGIIESSQAHNYAAAFFGVSLLLRATLPQSSRARLLNLGPRGLALAVLTMGCLIALSYQAIFFCGALGLALFLLEYPKLQPKRLGRLAGLSAGLLLWIAIFYRLHLWRFAAFRGHPSWADYPGSSNFLWRLFELLQGWFRVSENALCILPWGWQTFALSSLALALAGLGYWKARTDKRKPRWPLALALGLGLVWSWGAWTLRFPCGATRHTFVLQLPVLLLLGAGLGRLGLPKKTWLLAAGCLALGSAWALPGFFAGIQNRIDLAELEGLLSQHPQAMAVEPLLSFTRDPLLLLSKHSDWKGRLDTCNPDSPGASRELLLLSHRGPLLEETFGVLRKAGYQVQTLHALEPSGSLELSGNINGGNGYFLYWAKR